MNIEKANNRICEIDEEINDLLNKKEESLSKVLPKANTYDEEFISNTRVNKNKNLYYLIENEEIDTEIDFLYKEKEILLNYIEKELMRLKKYHETETLIIYYRDNKLKKYKWEEISSIVKLTKRQCINIYQKYKNKRNV